MPYRWKRKGTGEGEELLWGLLIMEMIMRGIQINRPRINVKPTKSSNMAEEMREFLPFLAAGQMIKLALVPPIETGSQVLKLPHTKLTTLFL